MANRRKTLEPTELPDGTQLHEHLVRQTLKMNPNLAGGQDAEQFIRLQSGNIADVLGSAQPENAPPTAEKIPIAVRLLIAEVERERQQHREVLNEISRARKALEKQEQTARKDAQRGIVNLLARKVRSVEELAAVLDAHKVFLEEMASSAKQITEQVGARRRKMTEK